MNIPEFAERGHTSVEELAWKLYAEMAVEVNRLPGHPNHKKEYARLFIEFVKKPCPVTYKLLTEVAASWELNIRLKKCLK